jgi:hypothetical protein
VAASVTSSDDGPFVPVDPRDMSSASPEEPPAPTVVSVERDPASESAAVAETTEQTRATREGQRHAPAPRGPREVVFSPVPQNVKIGVDGAEPRPFGPSFRSIELEPGPHRFAIVDQSGCCEDLVETVRIPAARTPFVYRPALRFRPARLYIVSSAPAEAEIRGPTGTSRGRTREILSIPMDALERTVTYTVTAADHQVYTGQVRLRAGQMTSPRVDLARSP